MKNPFAKKPVSGFSSFLKRYMWYQKRTIEAHKVYLTVFPMANKILRCVLNWSVGWLLSGNLYFG
jgi:hypothetical protein